MKIYLLDINKRITDAWVQYFTDIENVGFIEKVEIINDSFENFMNDHDDIDAIVSPANSFGLMDGGYDKAIVDYFGKELMLDVQTKIVEEWYGEQPVGTAMVVRIENQVVDVNSRLRYPLLIHVPTMRTPEVIQDTRIIYQCMRSTLIEAKAWGVQNIVIPAFGGLTGKVTPEEIAKMMYLALEQILNAPVNQKQMTWGYAWHVANKLRGK